MIKQLLPADGCEVIVYGARRIAIFEELELGWELRLGKVRRVRRELGREC